MAHELGIKFTLFIEYEKDGTDVIVFMSLFIKDM
jgi:hypothetical protein